MRPQPRPAAATVRHLALPRVRHRPARHHRRAGRRPPPPRRLRTGHPRPQGRRRAGAPAVRAVHRQRRLAAGRHPHAQPVALDRHPSASASATSRPSPRPCAAPCWACPDDSPAPRDAARCTYPTAGPGHTRSPWRLPGCAASRTRPDHGIHRAAPGHYHRPGAHPPAPPPTRPPTAPCRLRLVANRMHRSTTRSPRPAHTTAPQLTESANGGSRLRVSQRLGRRHPGQQEWSGARTVAPAGLAQRPDRHPSPTCP
jgi:hypothetical protein